MQTDHEYVVPWASACWNINCYFLLPYFALSLFDFIVRINTSQTSKDVFHTASLLLPTVLFNLFCVQVPVVCGLLWMIPVTTSMILEKSDITTFLILLSCFEVSYYVLHTLFHKVRCLQRFHKQHHSLSEKRMFALAAAYCHPVDHLALNVLPATLGFLLISQPAFSGAVVSTWSSAAAFSATYAHSGLSKHIKHHINAKVELGALGILDWLLGTTTSDSNLL
jgi:methylsterol monooxygenase